jgi:hypothetical protein
MPSQAADDQQDAQNGTSPQLQRLTTAPSATPAEDVWVTVPVDKVSVANGKGTVTPVYATAEGYRAPASGNAIPPVPAAGGGRR